MIYVALANSSDFIRIVGWVIYFSQIFSYTYTFLVNPGLPNKSMSLSKFEGRDSSAVKICDKCGIIVELGKGIVHCEDCGVCIIGKIYNTI